MTTITKSTASYALLIAISIILLCGACGDGQEQSKTEINEKILAGPDLKTWMIVSYPHRPG